MVRRLLYAWSGELFPMIGFGKMQIGETQKINSSIFRLRRERREFADALNRRAEELRFHNQHFTKALRLSRRAEKVAEQIDYKYGLGWALLNRARCLLHNDLSTETYRTLEKSLEIFQALKDANGEAVSLLMLGMSYLIDGEHIAAYQEYERGLNLSLHSQNKANEKLAYHFFASLSRRLEDYDSAIKYHRRELQIKEYSDLNARTLSNLALTFLLQGRTDEAKSHFDEALAVARKLDDKFSEASVHVQLAKLFIKQGEPQAARENLEIGLELAHQIGLYESSGLVGNGIVESYIALGDFQAALDILHVFENNKKIKEDPHRLPLVLLKIIAVNLQIGNRENVIESLNRVWEMIKNGSNRQMLFECQKAYADVFEMKGDFKRAFEHLQKAQVYKEILDRSGAAERVKIQVERSEIENLRRTTQSNNLRAEIGIALTTEGKSFGEVFQECADVFYSQLDLVLASIWLYDKAGDTLNRIATKGEQMTTQMAVIPKTKYLVGKVAATQKPVFNDDVQNCPDFADINWAKEKSVNSFSGFPLLIGDELIGVVALYSHEPIPNETLRTINFIFDLMAQGIQRREVRSQLERERDFYSAVTKTTTGYLFVFEPDGRIAATNKIGGEMLTKKGVTDFIGKRIGDVVTDENIVAVLEKWFAEFGSESIGIEKELKHLDEFGNPRYISWNSDVILNADGSVRYIISNGTDVTHIRKSEEALRLSEHKLRKLFDSSLVGLMICRLSGEIVETNDKFLDMLGYTRSEFENGDLNWRNITPPGHEQADELAVQQCIEQGFASPFEKEYYRKDGSRVPILIAVTGSIEFGLVTVFVLDLTESKKTEAALAESRDQLLMARKMEAIGRLAGGVAHDFNNLLTVINGYSEMALSRIAEENPLRKNLGEIAKAGNRAAELTKQLLTFSRRQVIKKEAINLNYIVEIMDSMVNRIIGEDIVIQKNLASDLKNIEADKGQLEQILLNFAVNAREAMPDGGEIRITTENVVTSQISTGNSVSGKTAVKLTFADTGSGMSAEIKEKVFEPFFTTKPDGTGLGLATVYGIVSQFGGFIELESEPEKGTTFHIFFPSADVQTTAAASPENEAVPDSEGETILIVEDEEMVRNLTGETLSFYGYKIIIAENGRHGLEVFEENRNRIDLILTDVIMPEMNGVSFIKNVRRTAPHINVIFMSGYTDLQEEINESVFGKEIFIQKPFVPTKLAATVQNVLRERKKG